MPSFEELRLRVAQESYGQFVALLHWYEAVSSESYIMLTTDDPLETIFNIGKSLEELKDMMKVGIYGLTKFWFSKFQNQRKNADFNLQIMSIFEMSASGPDFDFTASSSFAAMFQTPSTNSDWYQQKPKSEPNPLISKTLCHKDRCLLSNHSPFPQTYHKLKCFVTGAQVRARLRPH